MIKQNFQFLTNVNASVGNGQIRELHKTVQQENAERLLIFIDEGFSKTDLWLKKTLPKIEASIPLLKLVSVSGKREPSYDDLRSYLHSLRGEKYDLVIGVGGGSCMDISKALSVLLTNSEDPLQYRGFDKILKPGIKLILIPTTSGTGSEASYNASFVDKQSNKKLGINGKNMFAYKAILDGEATLSCPKFPLLGSAVDAIVHSLEGYVCNNSNIFSDMLAEKSIQLMINNISDINEKIGNVDKRLKLLEGSFLAGIVQMNSGSGVAAAISYPLSVYYGVPHGIGGGIFCLGIARWNIERGYDKYKYLSNLFNIKSGSSIDIINYIQEIFDSLGVPKKLNMFGIKNSDLDHLVKIMDTQQIAFDQNPVKFSVKHDFEKFIKDYL